ncbi:MAG: hypothetical protein KAV82_02600 [Phycisphaerae bacterium]|nr:hypothetical protein [Phycisphaerae bacterium]
MGERDSRWWLRAYSVAVVLCLVLVAAWGCQSVVPAPAVNGGDEVQTSANPVRDGDQPAEPPPGDNPTETRTERDTPQSDPPAQNDAGDEPRETQEQEEMAGDLNADGVIDDGDRDIFVAALNTTEGEEGFNSDLDYDGDGLISQIDYQTWYDQAFGG